jgi:uncharacterized repeat protein (TIGR03803 family)
MHALSGEHGSLMHIQATISLALAPCLGLAHEPARAGSGFRVLHTFTARKAERSTASWWRAPSNGNFYGSTRYGGAHSCGVLFRLGPEGDFKVLRHLDYSEGCNPKGALMQASEGYLYGTTRTELFRLKAE